MDTVLLLIPTNVYCTCTFACMRTLQGRRYTGRDYIVVAMIVVGLVVFMHADVHTATSFDMRGVSLISIALCIDAAITNLQVR
jgi:drug/metabolite transporter superfamily protein YnfA